MKQPTPRHSRSAIRASALCAALFLAHADAADHDLLDCSLAAQIAGESTPSGSCTVDIRPAPDAPKGMYSLCATFRLTQHRQNDWIDCATVPAPPLDLSATDSWRLWIRAEQSTDYLMVKIVDPENPGTNRAAAETALLHDGNALPADEWVPLTIQLPEDVKRRDGVTYFGFYIAAANEAVPLNRDLVFHIGRFPFVAPPRPPWPPGEAAESADLRTVYDAPLSADGPWTVVSGKDNQTDHVAEFADGQVMLAADAAGWNEFLWSVPEKLALKPLTTYRLAFNYEVLAPPAGGDDAMFYSLVRARGTIREDVGWQRWDGPAGMVGRRIVTFTTHDMPDYYLIFGVRHHGAIRIGNIRVREVTK